MNYVGIDIHKRYCVCAAQSEQGRELGVMRIEGNHGADFGQFLRGFGGTPRVARFTERSGSSQAGFPNATQRWSVDSKN